ncbi:MAG TPA: hypothetical protein VIH28_09925 [Ignavibacteriaceae bacterium]
MHSKLLSSIPFILLFTFAINFIGNSQNTDKSLAFKKNRPQKNYTIFYQPDLSYQIQKQFNLIRDANAGNALAQHELGLRYLLGEDGMTADTIKGAYWVGKAAEQNLTAACFNYGILLLNGWGVEWNPFKAYDYFLKAASDGMPQAQHLIGILYTDNLIVKKDNIEAYKWVKKASDQGYMPAIETKNDLEKYLPPNIFSANQDSSHNKVTGKSRNADTSLSSKLGLVFIDFETIYDTIMEVTEKQLIEDLFHESNKMLADTLGLLPADSLLTNIHTDRISLLQEYAETGNSEAITILGRFYEKGIYFENNLIKASMNYILASQLNYPRAKVLLLKILSSNFISDLISEVKTKKNPDAMFTLYGLSTLELYNQISKEEADNLLIIASKQNHLPSIIELANNYYTGKSKGGNVRTGLNLWKQAAQNGSIQAKIRLAAANVFDAINVESLDKSIQTLKEASKMGSVLAQISLAYGYENGIGVAVNKSEAVKYYRLTAQRGNQFGYEELKRIYNEIRPNEKRFIIN